MEHEVGGLGVEGDVAHLIDDDQRDAAEAAQLGLEAPQALRVEKARHHSVAVAKATRCPARQARMPSAIARCVLPVPGGPRRTTFSFPSRKSSCARCSTSSFFTDRWKDHSNSSRVLRLGKRAALTVVVDWRCFPCGPCSQDMGLLSKDKGLKDEGLQPEAAYRMRSSGTTPASSRSPA